MHDLLDPIRLAPLATSQCDVCHQKASYICKGCNAQSYCDAGHQRQDWMRHRLVCKSKVGESLQTPATIGDDVSDTNDDRPGVINAILRVAYYVGAAAQSVLIDQVLSTAPELLVRFTLKAADLLGAARDTVSTIACELAAMLPDMLDFMVNLTGITTAVNEPGRAAFTASEAHALRRACRRMFSAVDSASSWLIDLLRQAVRIMADGLDFLVGMFVKVADAASTALGQMIEWSWMAGETVVRNTAGRVLLPSVLFCCELPQTFAAIGSASRQRTEEIVGDASRYVSKAVARFLSTYVISEENRAAVIKYITHSEILAQALNLPVRAIDWALTTKLLRFLMNPAGFTSSRILGALNQYGIGLVSSVCQSALTTLKITDIDKAVISGPDDLIEFARKTGVLVRDAIDPHDKSTQDALIAFTQATLDLAAIEAGARATVRQEVTQKGALSYSSKLLQLTAQLSAASGRAWMRLAEGSADVPTEKNLSMRQERKRMLTGMTADDEKRQLLAAIKVLRLARPLVEVMQQREQKPVEGWLDFMRATYKPEVIAQKRAAYDASRLQAGYVRQYMTAVDLVGITTASDNFADEQAAKNVRELDRNALALAKAGFFTAIGAALILGGIWLASKDTPFSKLLQSYTESAIHQQSVSMMTNFAETVAAAKLAEAAAGVVSEVSATIEAAAKKEATHGFLLHLQEDTMRAGIYRYYFYKPALERMKQQDPAKYAEFMQQRVQDHDLLAPYYSIPPELKFAQKLASYSGSRATSEAPGFALLEAINSDQFRFLNANNAWRLGLVDRYVIPFQFTDDITMVDPTQNIEGYLPLMVTGDPVKTEAIKGAVYTSAYGSVTTVVALESEKVAYTGAPGAAQPAALGSGEQPRLALPGEKILQKINTGDNVISGDRLDMPDAMANDINTAIAFVSEQSGQKAASAIVSVPETSNNQEDLAIQTTRKPASYQWGWGTPKILHPIEVAVSKTGVRQTTVYSQGVLDYWAKNGKKPEDAVELKVSEISGRENSRMKAVQLANAKIGSQVLLTKTQKFLTTTLAVLTGWTQTVDYSAGQNVATMTDQERADLAQKKQDAERDVLAQQYGQFVIDFVFGYQKLVSTVLSWLSGLLDAVGVAISQLISGITGGSLFISGLNVLYTIGSLSMVVFFFKIAYEISYARMFRESVLKKASGVNRMLLPAEYDIYADNNYIQLIVQKNLVYLYPTAASYVTSAVLSVLSTYKWYIITAAIGHMIFKFGRGVAHAYSMGLF